MPKAKTKTKTVKTTKTAKSVKKTPVKQVVVKKVAAKKAPVKTVKKAVKVTKTAKPAAKVAVKAVAKKVIKPANTNTQNVVQVRAAVRANTLPQVKTVASAPQRHGYVAKPMPAPANDVVFKAGDFVVYPTHGVGTISAVDTQTIGGMTVQLYTVNFERDRMRLKIPVQKAATSGLRKLASNDRLKDALKTLTGRAKIKRTMWSRRAQEYEAKINSGDPLQIAEVLRDLRRPKDDTEQSYSERQIFQNALERLAREVAAVERVDEKKAIDKLQLILQKVA